MKDSLPLQVLNEKLPQFLQKCTQTFDFDRLYKNDFTVPPHLVTIGILLIHRFFFFFLFLRFLLDDFNSRLLGFLEVVWFLWK